MVATRLIFGLLERRERTLAKTNAPMRLDEDMQWSAIVPVKGHTEAKSRLEADPKGREALSRAFLADVLSALAGSEPISQVIVVTDDADLARLNSRDVRITLLVSQGLNEDIQQGLDLVGHGPAIVLTSDLPCLTTPALNDVLALARKYPLSFISDTQGLGTTMLLAHDATTCTPSYGIRSHARHVQAGFQELKSLDPRTRESLTRARRDVDTAIDLWDATRIGVGTATTALLAPNLIK
ncbi:MAG: 2-phospho-L-lactate guanylyltransferase [Actinobacteria bacterium]|uniref:Unannotated protein n=1 Tax=freshwater metagenome TaxID=449393 RepID=A0A6J7GYY9_9ZZZZ|nr:2-phospho-L-lactate guanylyltransferase [Actinomycetota bacterium]